MVGMCVHVWLAPITPAEPLVSSRAICLCCFASRFGPEELSCFLAPHGTPDGSVRASSTHYNSQHAPLQSAYCKRRPGYYDFGQVASSLASGSQTPSAWQQSPPSAASGNRQWQHPPPHFYLHPPPTTPAMTTDMTDSSRAESPSTFVSRPSTSMPQAMPSTHFSPFSNPTNSNGLRAISDGDGAAESREASREEVGEPLRSIRKSIEEPQAHVGTWALR
jgi:hypothetical protein